jgi:hypothetical protein
MALFDISFPHFPTCTLTGQIFGKGLKKSTNFFKIGQAFFLVLPLYTTVYTVQFFFLPRVEWVKKKHVLLIFYSWLGEGVYWAKCISEPDLPIMADRQVSFMFGKQHNNCPYFRGGSIQGLMADLFNTGSATVLFIFIFFFKNNHFKTF